MRVPDSGGMECSCPSVLYTDPVDPQGRRAKDDPVARRPHVFNRLSVLMLRRRQRRRANKSALNPPCAAPTFSKKNQKKPTTALPQTHAIMAK